MIIDNERRGGDKTVIKEVHDDGSFWMGVEKYCEQSMKGTRNKDVDRDAFLDSDVFLCEANRFD
jgi:hypothetical protein